MSATRTAEISVRVSPTRGFGRSHDRASARTLMIADKGMEFGFVRPQWTHRAASTGRSRLGRRTRSVAHSSVPQSRSPQSCSHSTSNAGRTAVDGQVHAGHWPPALDDGTYPAGVKISDHQIEALPLTKHDFHGDWNYTIAPG